MKRDLAPRPRHLLLPGALLVLAAVGVASRSSLTWRANQVDDNPQDFFAWSTTSSASYSFRYDPRAADEWLFQRGAGLLSTSRPPVTAEGATN